MSATKIKVIIGLVAIATICAIAKINGGEVPTILGIRAEFYLFALTLLGVALLHDNTLEVGLTGLTSVIILKLLTLPYDKFSSIVEHGKTEYLNPFQHINHESMILLNLLGLLLGFGILAKHFEESHIPKILPRFLPNGWFGGFILLVMVFFISSFLDNIAAAMIGGTIALVVFKKKVHIGYIAAIVAASNAGGSGSVVGDTTTTMMWIQGASPMDVLHAYYGAFPALFFCGIIGAIQQHKYSPLEKGGGEIVHIVWKKIYLVLLILIGAIYANVAYDFPAGGVWAAILVGALFVKTPWHEIPSSIKGTCFLLSLVLCASMMPVDSLPKQSILSAFGFGFISAVFDNIPLTKLALTQNGYDWGVLAYAVGFGGSMIWFGSSAGVAISNMFPEAKSVGKWVKSGWHVTVAYILGFAIMILALGGTWHPIQIDKKAQNNHTTETTGKTENLDPKKANTSSEQKPEKIAETIPAKEEPKQE